MKDTLHIVPHSHWDREWYMPFEKHRARLVELFDSLIKVMEESSEYTYYHMDGQYITVEDYLEIRPGMRERLIKLIRDGRIKIGPWYVLQDEYLTGGEANVRNMLYGIRLCRELGAEPVGCGYFPDAFGNISQAPQIIKGFGFDNAVFARGVSDVIFDSTHSEPNGICANELIWRAPDGSEVIGVLMANWYSNAMELPSDPDKLKVRIESIVKGLKSSALTNHFLGMNGCDHQPVQTDLHEIVRLANTVQDSIIVKQSNIEDYVSAIRPYKDSFPVYEGEINGQLSSGACPLICTASAHADIKQDNYFTEFLLERIAEPISVLSALNGGVYDSDMFLYTWKKLMQNHPHDSICACSCDEVYDEMKVRYAKARACAEQLRDNALEHLASVVDTQNTKSDKSILIFSLSPTDTVTTVKANIDFDPSEKVESISVFDENGNELAIKQSVSRNKFTYTLPRDSFRKVSFADRFELELSVELSGIGYRTLTVKKQTPNRKTQIAYGKREMENEFLSVRINDNGSFDLTDKRSGRVFRRQNLFEDTRDVGNLYNYVQPEGDMALTSAGANAEVSLHEVSASSVTFRVDLTLREGIELSSYLTLSDGIARLDIRTDVSNNAKNHRLRALFSTDLKTDTVMAEGQFDVVSRPIVPEASWKNPCYAQRLQAFIALEDESARQGAMIATRGICEYEILRDGRNTAALTLLRSVGEIGDWGDFPTPKGQKIGAYTFEYTFIPYSTDSRSDAYSLGYGFAYPAAVAISTDAHAGTLPSSADYFKLDSEYVRMSAMKLAESGDGIVLRLFNTHTEAVCTSLSLADRFGEVYLTDLGESKLSRLSISDHTVRLDIPKKKIVTLLIK